MTILHPCWSRSGNMPSIPGLLYGKKLLIAHLQAVMRTKIFLPAENSIPIFKPVYRLLLIGKVTQMMHFGADYKGICSISIPGLLYGKKLLIAHLQAAMRTKIFLPAEN
jgi:hypothetical protein